MTSFIYSLYSSLGGSGRNVLITLPTAGQIVSLDNVHQIQTERGDHLLIRNTPPPPIRMMSRHRTYLPAL